MPRDSTESGWLITFTSFIHLLFRPCLKWFVSYFCSFLHDLLMRCVFLCQTNIRRYFSCFCRQSWKVKLWCFKHWNEMSHKHLSKVPQPGRNKPPVNEPLPQIILFLPCLDATVPCLLKWSHQWMAVYNQHRTDTQGKLEKCLSSIVTQMWIYTDMEYVIVQYVVVCHISFYIVQQLTKEQTSLNIALSFQVPPH